jgi:DNA-binding NtrC family response regulator
MYRLKVFQIHLAPLRERPDDIPLLAQHFLKQLASRYAQTPIRIEASAQAALATHDWPGNVRELRNVLERAVLTQRSDTLGAKDLTLVGIQKPASAKLSTGGVSLDAMEREHLLSALTACDWNVSRAAKYLHISRDTLRYRMERHGLQR